MKKIIAMSIGTMILGLGLQAANFNAQAEKDRKAMIEYFEDKFENPEKNKDKFFPYSTDKEVKNEIAKGLKHHDFALGNYAYNIDGKMQYESMKEMPPYEDLVEEGRALYEKPFANGKGLNSCFGKPEAAANYPYYDNERKQVVTLTQAINECRTSNGEKKWNTKKGKMANVQGYMASTLAEAEMAIDVKIDSKEAAEAYERGKEYYYTQRGYLKLNCAECHVQGAGKRVRNEKLSQLLGHTTHFPVYRLKWNGLGTLERRMAGCIKDEGQIPPKATSDEMKELLFYMSYISNGMKYDGPDIRK